MYCGYANGLIAYGSEVAARTEQFFCPIKHARRIKSAHGHYSNFFEYGDAESYRLGLKRLRENLAQAAARRSTALPARRLLLQHRLDRQPCPEPLAALLLEHIRRAVAAGRPDSGNNQSTVQVIQGEEEGALS